MNSSREIVPVDETALTPEIEPWAGMAAALEVVDQPSLETAARYLHDIKAIREKIAEACDPVISAAHRAHKAAVQQKKDFEVPLLEAERLIKSKSANYIAAEERKAREAAALEEATRKEALATAEKEARELDEMGEAELADHVRTEAEADSAPDPQRSETSTRHRRLTPRGIGRSVDWERSSVENSEGLPCKAVA